MTQSNPEQCRDVMTPDPVCCSVSDSATDAARVMAEHDVGPVPVVDSQASKRLVGIVTDRDLAVRVIAEGRSAKTTRLSDIISRNLVTCSPDDDLNVCLERMQSHQLRRIPVVDQNRRIIGVISQADIALRLRERSKTADVVEQVSRPKTMTGGGGA
jgi:CBS domain-containing protein